MLKKSPKQTALKEQKTSKLWLTIENIRALKARNVLDKIDSLIVKPVSFRQF